jgi:rod shape-determining protein MreD
MLWVSFILIAAVASLPMWLAASFMLGQFVDPSPVLLQYLATIAVYPCLAWLFGQAQQAFLRTA